jgi:hypothetical protein
MDDIYRYNIYDCDIIIIIILFIVKFNAQVSYNTNIIFTQNVLIFFKSIFILNHHDEKAKPPVVCIF